MRRRVCHCVSLCVHALIVEDTTNPHTVTVLSHLSISSLARIFTKCTHRGAKLAANCRRSNLRERGLHRLGNMCLVREHECPSRSSCCCIGLGHNISSIVRTLTSGSTSTTTTISNSIGIPGSSECDISTGKRLTRAYVCAGFTNMTISLPSLVANLLSVRRLGTP